MWMQRFPVPPHGGFPVAILVLSLQARLLPPPPFRLPNPPRTSLCKWSVSRCHPMEVSMWPFWCWLRKQRCCPLSIQASFIPSSTFLKEHILLTNNCLSQSIIYYCRNFKYFDTLNSILHRKFDANPLIVLCMLKRYKSLFGNILIEGLQEWVGYPLLV